jgi:hypothetical protein
MYHVTLNTVFSVLGEHVQKVDITHCEIIPVTIFRSEMVLLSTYIGSTSINRVS